MTMMTNDDPNAFTGIAAAAADDIVQLVRFV